MNIEIRQESPHDQEAIYHLLFKAFGQKDEADLVDKLRNSSSFVKELSLVATNKEIIVGYILFTKVILESKDSEHSGSLALAPVAVLPDFQLTGIGSMLIEAGLKEAKNLKYKSVIVLGHEHYYPKFGFIPASKRGIRCPFNVSDNSFMILELVENGLEGISGTVKYDKAFSAFE